MNTTLKTMPSTARAWVFGATTPVTGAVADNLLRAVDDYLSSWKAHGAPLLCARDWQHDRFLTIAVDEAATGASGCSIDGLFRVLTTLESALGVSMVDRGRVFWRRSDKTVVSGSRAEFVAAARDGDVDNGTTVFDTTITTVGAWREHFERPLPESWHARLISR